jgi:type VI secretion system protein ImpL
MTTIRDSLEKENWVLGEAGEQNAIKQQYDSLLPDILEQYGREFVAAWGVINNLQLKPLLSDKPRYIALNAASSPQSPIKLIFESVRDETALTRERKAPATTESAADQATSDAEKALQQRMGSIGREAFKLAKSQRRAGDPPTDVPGAAIEAQFKPYHLLVDGEPGTRPMDSLLANLQELDRQLTLAGTNPAMAPAALAQVDVQVASLRSNVTRLPPPLMGMMDKVAHDAARSVASSNIADLADAMTQEVTAPCQQLIAKNYPFSGKSDHDMPMTDFARLFGPNGVIDRFFSTRVASLVNIGPNSWTWAPNPNLGRKLSDATLRHFKEARDIRDAFFPTGGAFPNVSLEVRLLSISNQATTATLTVNGSAVAFQSGAPPALAPATPQPTPASATPSPTPTPTPTGPPPLPAHGAATIQWPGAGAGAASVALAPDLPDGPSEKQVNGGWALFRLIDRSSVIQRGQSISASFVIGGREVSFQLSAASLSNPLTMPSLRQFSCPSGLWG